MRAASAIASLGAGACMLLFATTASAQPGALPRTTLHAAVGGFFPPASGVFRGAVPLVAGQFGVRLTRRLALTATGEMAQPRCDRDRCTDALLAGLDVGAERRIADLAAPQASLFVSAGAGSRWYRIASADSTRQWVPAGFLGFGAELRRGRAGARAESRLYGSRPPIPGARAWQPDFIAIIALGYHFR